MNSTIDPSPPDPVRVVVVGGIDRLARGPCVQHHTGSMSQPSRRALEHMIAHADVVVVITGINSHAAVRFARERARHHGVPSLICRRFGAQNLARLVDAVTVHAKNGTRAEARRRATAGFVGALVGVACPNE